MLTDRRTNDGQKVIVIAHSELCSGKLTNHEKGHFFEQGSAKLCHRKYMTNASFAEKGWDFKP